MLIGQGTYTLFVIHAHGPVTLWIQMMRQKGKEIRFSDERRDGGHV